MGKKVKVILTHPPKSYKSDQGEVFEVKKVVNTIQVLVGEYVDKNLVKDWIKKDKWTVEFV